MDYGDITVQLLYLHDVSYRHVTEEEIFEKKCEIRF